MFKPTDSTYLFVFLLTGMFTSIREKLTSLIGQISIKPKTSIIDVNTRSQIQQISSWLSPFFQEMKAIVPGEKITPVDVVVELMQYQAFTDDYQRSQLSPFLNDLSFLSSNVAGATSIDQLVALGKRSAIPNVQNAALSVGNRFSNWRKQFNMALTGLTQFNVYDDTLRDLILKTLGKALLLLSEMDPRNYVYNNNDGNLPGSKGQVLNRWAITELTQWASLTAAHFAGGFARMNETAASQQGLTHCKSLLEVQDEWGARAVAIAANVGFINGSALDKTLLLLNWQEQLGTPMQIFQYNVSAPTTCTNCDVTFHVEVQHSGLLQNGAFGFVALVNTPIVTLTMVNNSGGAITPITLGIGAGTAAGTVGAYSAIIKASCVTNAGTLTLFAQFPVGAAGINTSINVKVMSVESLAEPTAVAPVNYVDQTGNYVQLANNASYSDIFGVSYDISSRGGMCLRDFLSIKHADTLSDFRFAINALFTRDGNTNVSLVQKYQGILGAFNDNTTCIGFISDPICWIQRKYITNPITNGMFANFWRELNKDLIAYQALVAGAPDYIDFFIDDWRS